MKKTGTLVLLILLAVSGVFSSSTTRKINLLIRDSVTGYSDQTLIYFDIGTTPLFRFPEDVLKTLDTVQAIPQIYSYSSDNVTCYSNGYGTFNNTTVIPLGLRVGVGTYTISSYGLSNFDAATFILLEDRLLGTFTNMKATSYAIHTTAAGMISNRFFIHFTYPPVLSSTQAGCANSDGSVMVTQDSSITWTSCILYDSSGMNALQTNNQVKGNMNFTGLPEGVYSVSFIYGTDTITKDIEVAGNQIIASIASSLTYANVNEVINFSAFVTHASQYDWDFGDSTLITGITHPTYAYSDTGTYNVVLKCSNAFGCVAYAYKTIFISTATGVPVIPTGAVSIMNDYRDLRITVAEFSGTDYDYELYNISGQLLTSGHITSSDFIVPLNERATGIYIISVKNSTGARLSKKVFMTE